jgi:hypothetical protein
MTRHRDRDPERFDDQGPIFFVRSLVGLDLRESADNLRNLRFLLSRSESRPDA